MTQVAVGSTVLIHVPGSRSTEGQPVDIPAVVLSQDPEDHVLTLFAMHFEGQFIQRRKPDEITVLIDVNRPSMHAIIVGLVESAMFALRDGLRDEIETKQRQISALNLGLVDAALVELRNNTRNEIETIQRQFTEFQEQILELVAGGGSAAPVTGPIGPDKNDAPFEVDIVAEELPPSEASPAYPRQRRR